MKLARWKTYCGTLLDGVTQARWNTEVNPPVFAVFVKKRKKGGGGGGGGRERKRERERESRKSERERGRGREREGGSK